MGAGLLAKAVGQSIHHCLDDRYRGQARLPHLNGGQAQTSVGAGLPAKAVDLLKISDRYTGTDRSHALRGNAAVDALRPIARS